VGFLLPPFRNPSLTGLFFVFFLLPRGPRSFVFTFFLCFQCPLQPPFHGTFFYRLFSTVACRRKAPRFLIPCTPLPPSEDRSICSVFSSFHFPSFIFGGKYSSTTFELRFPPLFSLCSNTDTSSSGRAAVQCPPGQLDSSPPSSLFFLDQSLLAEAASISSPLFLHLETKSFPFEKNFPTFSLCYGKTRFRPTLRFPSPSLKPIPFFLPTPEELESARRGFLFFFLLGFFYPSSSFDKKFLV